MKLKADGNFFHRTKLHLFRMNVQIWQHSHAIKQRNAVILYTDELLNEGVPSYRRVVTGFCYTKYLYMSTNLGGLTHHTARLLYGII